MKKAIGFMLALIMAFALTACGTNDLRRRVFDLENQIGQKTDNSDTDDLLRQIADLENQAKQQTEKIAELENELKSLKTHDDFVLTITTDSSFAINGQTVIVNATLKNQSGKSYNIAYSRLMDWKIAPEGLVDYPNYEENEVPPPTEDPSAQLFLGRINHDMTIHHSYNIPITQGTGTHEIYVIGCFSVDLSDAENWSRSEIDWDKMKDIFIVSNKIAIIVS